MEKDKKDRKNKVIIGIIIISIVIILSIIFFIVDRKDKKENSLEENWENPYTEIDKNEIEYQENATIDELKEETGLTADSNLYEINTEYDGRKVLNIKTDIQYKVAFAGIIKGQAPTIEEIDTIMQENHPTENGIWIEKNSRTKLLELLKENTNSEYDINEKGYLIIKEKREQNDIDKNLERLINTNKQTIVTISNIYYEVDSVTGEIVEYPFEQLDNYQAYDQITSGDNTIIVITSNANQTLTNQEILRQWTQF